MRARRCVCVCVCVCGGGGGGGAYGRFTGDEALDTYFLVWVRGCVDAMPFLPQEMPCEFWPILSSTPVHEGQTSHTQRWPTVGVRFGAHAVSPHCRLSTAVLTARPCCLWCAAVPCMACDRDAATRTARGCTGSVHDECTFYLRPHCHQSLGCAGA